MSKVKSKKLKVSNGFTLLELLLVVGIMAVIFGLALPFALNTKFTNELDAATENLITTLKEAQSQSIAGEGDVPYGVYFDTGASPKTYTIYKGTSYADRDASFNTGGYGTTELPKNAIITFAPAAWTSNEITFARLTGKPLDTTVGKTITLNIPGIGSKTITITPEGVIY